MDQSNKDFHKQTTKRLQPSINRRGIITRVNISSWVADVQVVGNNQSVLKNIPLSSAVPITVMIGDRCVLDTLDENNPSDIVVAFIYGRSPSAINKIASGFFSVPAGTHQAVPHGLGVTPNFVTVSTFPGASGSLFIPDATVWVSQTLPVADDTNIYADNGGVGARNTYWAAGYIII